MHQELSIQRDELAQAHQLDKLLKEYTIYRVGKLIAIGGVVLFIFAIILFTRIVSMVGITNSILWVLALTGLVGGVWGGWLYYYRRLHVYIYTGGLIYLNGNNRKAVRWDQITSISKMSRGAFSIYAKGEPRIGFPALISESNELYYEITLAVEIRRRSGQEKEQRDVFTTHR